MNGNTRNFCRADASSDGCSAKQADKYSAPVSTRPAVRSRPITEAVDEALYADVERIRREAKGLVERWFEKADKAVSGECRFKTSGLVCMCSAGVEACYDRLVAEINESGTLRIVGLVAATQHVLQPNGRPTGEIPLYAEIEATLATVMGRGASLHKFPRRHYPSESE